MPGFRDRFSRTNSFDLWTQNAANDPVFRGYGKAAGLSAAIISPGPQALIDTVPGNTSTTATLTVDAAPIVSAVDTIADEDFYSIQLVAGHEYQIGMYGYTPQGPGDPPGPNGVPLSDSFIELYDANGNLITSADGGSDTTFNTANSGFDALLTFTATETRHLLCKRPRLRQYAADGSDNGDLVGDYGLYAKDVDRRPDRLPPLLRRQQPALRDRLGHAGQQDPPDLPQSGRQRRHARHRQSAVAGRSRRGARPSRARMSSASISPRPATCSSSNDPTNPGLPPATITATGVQGFEHDAVMTALGEFSKVADIVYVEVNGPRPGRFHLHQLHRHARARASRLLGSMSPPDEGDEGLAQFNSGDERWNAADLQQGGFSLRHTDPRIRPRPRPRPSARQWRPFRHHARRRARRRRRRRLHDRRFRPQPGRLHDDVLRGRLAEFALRPRPTTNDGYG